MQICEGVTTTPVLQVTHYEYSLALAPHVGHIFFIWQGLSQIMQQGLRILDCLTAARCYPPAFGRCVVYLCTGGYPGPASNLRLQITASCWAKPSEVPQKPSRFYQWMRGEDFTRLMENAQKVYKLNFRQPSCKICFCKRLLYGQLACYPCYNISRTVHNKEQAFGILCL